LSDDDEIKDRSMAHDLSRRGILIAGSALVAAPLAAALEPAVGASISELNVADRASRVWSWTPSCEAKGTILFSHGAASAPWKYTKLIKYWVDAGYAVHAPLHVDSTDHPQQSEFAGFDSWRARLEDMAVLADRFGGEEYIAAGHSYGGLTALTLGGAEAVIPEGYTDTLKDDRVALVLAFSPPGSIPGFVNPGAYSGVSVPSFIQTGTADAPPGMTGGWEAHLDAYHDAPATGTAHALVIEGVDHYFKGAICRTELPGPPQDAELGIAAEFSLLMLEAYTRHDEDAQAELSTRLSPDGAVRFMAK
jgi:predicted dienelactone hydrolase